MLTDLYQFFKLSLLVQALLPLAAALVSHPIHRGRHEIARRAEGHVGLWKRVDNSRWTLYDTQTGNAGSCGRFIQNTEFVVAMNHVQMNPAWCFRTVTLTYGGKTTTASVQDTCPKCQWGEIDLSIGLFEFFAPQSIGVIFGSWNFVDAGNPAPSPSPSPRPSPSPTPTSRSSTSSSSRTTGISAAPTSSVTTSLNSTTSTTSSSSIDYSSGAASGLAIATGLIDTSPSQANNLLSLSQAFVEIGALVMAARNA